MSDLRAAPTNLHYREARRWSRFLKRCLRSRNVMAGAVVLGAVIMLVVLAAQISPYEPTQQFRRHRLQPPNAEFLLGTDNLGRDILTRILYGGRVSLQVGIVSVAIGATIGTLLGLIAGYIGGWTDVLIMRFIDMMLAFPGILLALVIIAVLGRNLQNVMIAVGLSSIPVYTRVVRGSALSVKQFDFIVAAQALGASSWRIMARHILPNVLAPIIVVATNGVAGAIISGAALSFLGLGQQPPDPEWGLMLNEGRDYIRVAAWVTTYPGLAIMITVLSINLLGDGLRDILDPRLKL
ncbi:MAG: ABC transporter permease [Chloroflexi bacterium]|nr:ABC transporter permease [Chloroflexota bacterium]